MFFGLCVFPSFNNITKISLRSLIQLLILPLLLCTYSPCQYWSSLVAQMVKNLPAVHETWVRSLGQEDPLEKGMTTHSSIRAWRIPGTEEPGGLQSMGLQRVGHDWVTNVFTFSVCACQSQSSSLSLSPLFPTVTLVLFSTSVSLFMF